MLRSEIRLAVVAGALVSAVASPAADETPAAALSRAAESYRALPELAERLDYTVRFPDGREEHKAIEYGRAAGRVFLALLAGDGSRIFHVTAGDGALRGVQFNAGGAFLETSYGGSFGAALESAGALQIGLSVPPALAAVEPPAGGAQSADAAFLQSFGFGVLPELEPSAVATAGGVTRVTLSAPAGGGVVELDAESGRVTGLSLEVGGEGSKVRFRGSVTALEVPPDDPRWTIDTAGRQPVATFAELEASAFPLGEPAPDLEVLSLDGETIALAALRGRVVILDFWATWCVPCWAGLEKFERFAHWASESGLPITVWTVNTLEQTTSFEDQAALASGFLASRDLEVPVLIDFDDGFFAGLHSPGLPSTVVIAPDGTLAHYHSGSSDDMEEELRAQATALLADDPGPGKDRS